ncbi:alpha/beta hydrolase [Agrococcus sp. SL85]|uniref:alpha/beta fold hydrolase n=1 Tax=Agrococcus sp. SL85 TaxID=2995141 RepID=UPI00226D0BD1|nr:alpha/beta hydrolase [Agrococcus sp. SL85]WAC67328.1 alpha/beta hydrolase [Agrococcus sp. SL85]
MTVFAMSPDGVRIALHELGDPEGLPVLMIHGFSSNARRNWIDTGWGRALEREGLRGIAMDLRGHGDSDRPTTGYEVPRFLDDVDAVLEQLMLDEPPAAIGYSMGARLLWRHAGTRTLAFRALVLGGLPAGDPFQRFDTALALRALEGQAEPGPMESFVVDLAGVFPEHDPATLVHLAGEVSHTLFDAAAAPPPQPTLLMTGDEDARAADTRTLLPLLPQGSFLPIPGRNHMNAPVSGTFRREATRFLATQLRGEG